jgi:hypothetical protein
MRRVQGVFRWRKSHQRKAEKGPICVDLGGSSLFRFLGGDFTCPPESRFESTSGSMNPELQPPIKSESVGDYQRSRLSRVNATHFIFRT